MHFKFENLFYSYTSSFYYHCQLEENLIFALVTIILNFSTARTMLSLILSVGPLPNAKKNIFTVISLN